MIMIVCVFRVLNCVLYELLECRALAHEFDKLRNTATAAEHDELLLLKKQLFDSAALLLVQDLVDLDVSSTAKNTSSFYKNSSEIMQVDLPLVENKV